ncbi:MAG: thermonuclease family protein [Dehalococcoidia bacterium]
MRFWIALFVATLALAACTAAPTATHETANLPEGVVCQWAKVVRVTDGDTIRVDITDGSRNQPVRYIGVDTPETVHPTLGVQPFGPEASARNKELVANKQVCLEKDVSETDRYDRLLRYVWLPDGRMVDEVLVAEGLATVDTFPPDVKYVERFIAAQQTARASRRGMWADEAD